VLFKRKIERQKKKGLKDRVSAENSTAISKLVAGVKQTGPKLGLSPIGAHVNRKKRRKEEFRGKRSDLLLVPHLRKTRGERSRKASFM